MDDVEVVENDPEDAFFHYFSTYCIHGLHADCRLTCKTCSKPCRCECHSPAIPASDSYI